MKIVQQQKKKQTMVLPVFIIDSQAKNHQTAKVNSPPGKIEVLYGNCIPNR